MIIGLSGYAQSGKDTVAAILVEYAGFERIAFADALRDMLYAVNPLVRCGVRVQDVVDRDGWDAAKVDTPEIRELLQRLGTEGGREVLGPNVWVDAAMRKLSAPRIIDGRSYHGLYVITDVRFPSEYDAVRDRGGAVWRVTRPGRNAVNAHISETVLDDYHFDAYVCNDGTLEALADQVLIGYPWPT